MKTILLAITMISLRLWSQPFNPFMPPEAVRFPGPPPEGHRWVAKMVPAAAYHTNADGRVIYEQMTVLYSEPIPVEQPRLYTCIHVDGTTETRFSTYAAALAACNSGTQEFVNKHVAIVATTPSNTLEVVWEFKPNMHMRRPVPDQSGVTNVSHVHDPPSVGGPPARRASTTMPPMPPLRTNLNLRLFNPKSGMAIPPPPPTSVVTDTTPPVITNFIVRQSVLGDFPVMVPTAIRFANNLGTIIDAHTLTVTSNVIVMTFHGLSNHCYTVWCTGNLKSGAWLEYPLYNLCPRSVENEVVVLLPVLNADKRFYQLRSST